MVPSGAANEPPAWLARTTRQVLQLEYLLERAARVGRSRASAFRDIRKAVATGVIVRAGDGIYLRRGVVARWHKSGWRSVPKDEARRVLRTLEECGLGPVHACLIA